MLILWLSFTTIQARSTEDVPDKGTYAKFLLVGCYMKSDEEGVRMYRFDGQTADVDYPCGLRGISNPAFLTSDSTGNRIYAIGDDEGKSSTANALLFDAIVPAFFYSAHFQQNELFLYHVATFLSYPVRIP